MKQLLAVSQSLLTILSLAVMGQKSGSATAAPQAAANSTRKRGPVFRATKEQIKQAQVLLKGRGFYAGEESGKLDDATRAGLKKYQEAEGVKVTGTLNKATLEKMSIALTDKQKMWKPAM